jgi:hypothetical protein
MRKFPDEVLRHAQEAAASIIRWRTVRYLTMAGNQQELSVDNACFTGEDRAQLDRIDEARETICEHMKKCVLIPNMVNAGSKDFEKPDWLFDFWH